MRTPLPLVDRFWSNVNKNGPKPSAEAVSVYPEIAGTNCWLWTGCKNRKNGYGRIRHGTRRDQAHRVAWFLETGEWPTPCGLHKCDNPACVRFLHLFEGTQAQNNKDREIKGRGNQARGQYQGHAKLTDYDVKQIRIALAAAQRKYGTLGQLAHKYKVSLSCISKINAGETYAHIAA